jgi:enamine deaminase RidA (YjgF/YER057c/UK114 family)
MTTIVSTNPPALARPNGFAHVASCPGNGVAFISGQVAYDATGAIVGDGDLEAQTHQVFRNLGAALAAIGCDFGDVAKFTFFVKDMSEEAIATIRSVRVHYLPQDRLPASTMVGVAALAKPALRLEVEAYVVLRPAA